MTKKTALVALLIISIAGMLFSGYLSYTEFFLKICGAEQLGMGQCTEVLEIPACLYGFVMYTIAFFVSIFGLISKE